MTLPEPIDPVDTAIRNQREERLREAAVDAARMALLDVTPDNVEHHLSRRSAVPPTVDEIQQMLALVHGAQITITRTSI